MFFNPYILSVLNVFFIAWSSCVSVFLFIHLFIYLFIYLFNNVLSWPHRRCSSFWDNLHNMFTIVYQHHYHLLLGKLKICWLTQEYFLCDTIFKLLHEIAVPENESKILHVTKNTCVCMRNICLFLTGR